MEWRFLVLPQQLLPSSAFLADTWPVARAFHSSETLSRCGAYNRRTKSTAPVPLKARVRHAFRSTRQTSG